VATVNLFQWRYIYFIGSKLTSKATNFFSGSKLASMATNFFSGSKLASMATNFDSNVEQTMSAYKCKPINV